MINNQDVKTNWIYNVYIQHDYAYNLESFKMPHVVLVPCWHVHKQNLNEKESIMSNSSMHCNYYKYYIVFYHYISVQIDT